MTDSSRPTTSSWSSPAAASRSEPPPCLWHSRPMPACRNLKPSRSQAYDLTDPKLPCSDNRPINARVVFVHADHGLQYVGVCFGCVRVKIDHHATLVPHGDADGRTRPLGAKFQDLAHPSIFLEWLSGPGVDH